MRFLRDLGAAYRASGRTLPLMDELGLHPYPRSDRDSALAGDTWPRAGLVNIARVKQALWDAFAGTGQPTVEQGLKLRIDEIGWQAAVPASARSAYFGRETAAVTSERAQAANYVKLIELAACDRSISGALPPAPAGRSRPRAVPVRAAARRRDAEAGAHVGARSDRARQAGLRAEGERPGGTRPA